ncbi:hypothetical protein ACQY0O_001797 [Thecaphora frezii]
MAESPRSAAQSVDQISLPTVATTPLDHSYLQHHAHNHLQPFHPASLPHHQHEPKPDPYLVTWADASVDADPDNPLGWSTVHKWSNVAMVSAASFCVTCTSSVISNAYQGITDEFHVAKEPAILGLSLFVAGLGFGPLFLAPLSEFYGRRPIYLWSYSAFFLLGFPVSFANNLAVFLVFRFLTGFCGSAFLSVAGGTVSDVFERHNVFLPMAVYTISPFIGPVAGPIISGFINQNTDWRWTFWFINIWSGCTLFALVLLAPETFAPIILTKRARKLRKQTGNEKLYAAHERSIGRKSITRTIFASCTKPFMLLVHEYMLTLLCIWSALLLGILYLLFIAFPIVFRQHGFNLQEIGLSFLGLGMGQVVALGTMPYWARRYAAASRASPDGKAPPEARLPVGMVGAVLMPIGMLWFAFTSYASVHWIVPILAGIPIGTAIGYIYTATFTFIVDAYRPVAASAMAANSAVRSSWAFAFPLFSGQMYKAMGVVGASAFLAGLNILMVPLPFVFYKYGARIRARSRFTNHEGGAKPPS